MTPMDLPVIKNRDILGTTMLRLDALDILEAGYEAVLTERVITQALRREEDDLIIGDRTLSLSRYARVLVVAIGKCAVDAALALERILGDRISGGIVLDVRAVQFDRLRSFQGTHPFPSEANREATTEIVGLLRSTTEQDLVIAVISGGGSALLTLPYQMTPDELQRMTAALWEKGATIAEVNTVRKHTSLILGGHFAKEAHPATVLSFIFSDVPGNDIETIASGPTVMDASTIAEADAILRKYDVREKTGLSIPLLETPKDATYFARVLNELVVTNRTALEAMAARAESLGYAAEIKDDRIQGIASEVGATIVSGVIPGKHCLLWGGETTVRVTGGGTGGRNQELALGAARVIPDGVVLVAAASDGWDNSDVAGAITDAGDRKRAEMLGLDPDAILAENDSYRFWQRVGGAIVTGRTGINVADCYMVLTE
jgi:glycerate-2-kinase